MNNTALHVELKDNMLFLGLTSQQVESILPCITYKIASYNTDQRVYNKGDIVKNLGIVLEGQLAISSESADGKRSVVTHIDPNQIFGEALIFSTGHAIPHDVTATMPTKVLFFTTDFFLAPCDTDCPNAASHTEVIKNLLRILSDRTMVLNRKIKYLTAPTLKIKLAMYLYDLHIASGLLNFNMPMNRDRLAEYLAVARPSLSREFVALKEEGVIDFYRSSVKILDLHQLYEIAHS